MNKICLILGSNSAVGQAAATVFAKNQFDLYLATRNVDAYQKRLSADLSIKHHVRCTNLRFDASEYQQHELFVEELPVLPDVVISVFGALTDNHIAWENFEACYPILNANYTGHVSILNLLSQQMKKQGKGVIIGISSVAGERGRGSNFIYGSAKAGFTAYLSGLRNALYKDGVHVATVVPGFIRTKMIEGVATPQKLTASSEEVGTAIWKAYSKKKNIVYVRAIWRPIMFLIRSIPEGIFKKRNL